MKKLILKVLAVFVSLGVLGGLAGVGILVYFSFGLPQISTLNDYRPAIPSKILAKDGTVLADLGKENRSVAKFEEIPKRVVDAFLSAEDDSFYEHTGVDYMGVFRAFVANLKAGKVVQGGSTITQQVAKSLLLSNERSYSRKIKDILLAQRIEEKLTKEEILYLYLNQVYLGGGYHGVKSAFEGYYGKSLSEATVAEASQVAGLLVAPGRYSPYINPKRARIRQRYVLKRMYDTGKITQSEYESAVNEKIKFRIRKPEPFKAGHFTDWVRQRAVSLLGSEEFLTDGYVIQTTIDYDLQKIAEEKVLETVKEVDKRQGYKGPFGNIKLEELDAYREKFLKEFYNDKSTYFTLTEDDKKNFELELEEEELNDLKSYREQFRNLISSERFLAGTSPNSNFKKYLNYGDTHKAIVLSIDDWARIVYVDLGGVMGIIPYSGFRWAHTRNIAEERNFYSYVMKPSTILKEGDEILVRVLKTETTLMEEATDSFQDYVNKQSGQFKKEVKSQKFVKLMLEQEPEVEGALVSLDPDSGDVISLVGGVDFSKSQFNRALQSKRQPGSSFKPFLFAAALENGYTPSTIIIDSPETLGGFDESLNWKPRNYDGKFKGPTTLRNSLEQSRNVPTVKMANDLGVKKILDFVERIGMDAKLDEDLSLSLGSFGVTLMEMVKSYAIFPNGGKKIKPRSIISITDRFGNPVPFNEDYEDLKTPAKEEVANNVEKEEPTPQINEAEIKQMTDELVQAQEAPEKEEVNPFHENLGGNQVYDNRLAYIMTNLLRGVVLHGTGRSAKSVSSFLGGKTGTTNAYVDAWFLGFSQNIVTGVWTGFDENQTLGWGETGAKAALPVWRDFMEAGLRKYGEYDFRPPQGIVNVLVDKETGRPVDSSNQNAFLESFVEGTEPGSKGLMEKEDQDPSLNGPILEEDDFYMSQ